MSKVKGIGGTLTFEYIIDFQMQFTYTADTLILYGLSTHDVPENVGPI